MYILQWISYFGKYEPGIPHSLEKWCVKTLNFIRNLWNVHVNSKKILLSVVSKKLSAIYMLPCCIEQTTTYIIKPILWYDHRIAYLLEQTQSLCIFTFEHSKLVCVLDNWWLAGVHVVLLFWKIWCCQHQGEVYVSVYVIFFNLKGWFFNTTQIKPAQTQ